MTDPYQGIRAALAEAKQFDDAVGRYAETTAELLNRPGALRRVSPRELKKLKRELRHFDMTTDRWKS